MTMFADKIPQIPPQRAVRCALSVCLQKDDANKNPQAN